jgi:hypothetical protein
MPIPEKIRVTRMIDYHTHFIGKYDNGKQFFGYNHFINTPFKSGDDWQNYRHEYVVLYLFDEKGDFKSYKHHYAGTTANLNCDTEKKLKEMVKGLGKVRYCNIKVKPFEIEIDGHIFGLIPKTDDGYERVELHPSNVIAFTEPWVGEYDT